MAGTGDISAQAKHGCGKSKELNFEPSYGKTDPESMREGRSSEVGGGVGVMFEVRCRSVKI